MFHAPPVDVVTRVGILHPVNQGLVIMIASKFGRKKAVQQKSLKIDASSKIAI
jgi:hypothetical protein